MSAHQNPPKRPRLSLQIKAISSGPNLRASRTIAAAVNPTSPTAFNTLSNVYVTAIDRATPITAINTTQLLKIQTQNLTKEHHGTQTPYASTYPETPLTAQPLSPTVTAMRQMPFPSTMTATPPLSAGPVDANDAKPFSFSREDTVVASTSSLIKPTAPSAPAIPAASAATTSGTVRRRATLPLNVCRPTTALPYARNRSLHSILRNSPLPPPTAKTPVSPRRQSARLAEKAARRVGYESPIERVITTNHYVKSHIDLLVEEVSPASPFTAGSEDQRQQRQQQQQQQQGQDQDLDLMVLDLSMAYAGDEIRDGGATPGPFEEIRRRMAGLVTRTPTSPSGPGSSPAGIRKRRKKERNRRWVWTIGTQDDDLDNREVGGAVAAIRAASRSSAPAIIGTAVPPSSRATTYPTVVVESVALSPMEIPTPSIETFDEAAADVVMSESEAETSIVLATDERRAISLAPADMDLDLITPTVTRRNHLQLMPSRSVRSDSESLFNSETGSRRDTPIPADLIATE